MSEATPPFGLYPSRALVPAQRLAAGAELALDTPVNDGGVVLFRRSLWLPVPAGARACERLLLAASALKLRYAPVTLTVGTDDTAWMPRVDTADDNQTVTITLAWPATVSRLADPFNHHLEAFDLFRMDGNTPADKPTMSGRSSQALHPPWVGSPMRVVMAQKILPPLILAQVGSFGFATKDGPPQARAAVVAGGAGGVAEQAGGVGAGLGAAAQAFRRTASHVVPALVIAGAPTGPRMKLCIEARGDQPETPLWQALLPGEQGTVTLPATAVADEWAPALEQVRARLAAESPPNDAPALLRLDVESDAPCSAQFTQLALALDGELELAGTGLRADFDGSRAQSVALPLPWPAGTLQSVQLQGRVGGGTDGAADAAALPANGRQGLLLQPGQRVRVHASFDTPARVAGLSIAWLPLSDALKLTLRLLPDAVDAPSLVPLLEQTLALDTPAPGWLALRTPVLDLQPQHLWVELSVAEGSGLWGADAAAPPPSQGSSEQLDAQPPLRQPLGLAPALAWLPPPSAPGAPRQVQLLAGAQPVAAALASDFTLDCPAPALPLLASQGLQARSASAAQLTLQSARARVRLA